jgi:hypothetical protein
MKAAGKRQKGKRLERDVAKHFQKHIDPYCKPQLLSGADEWNRGDIRFSKNIGLKLSIECKNQEKIKFWEWWKQTKDQATNFEKPVLIFKRNFSDTIVAMKIEDWMDILEELYDYKEQNGDL